MEDVLPIENSAFYRIAFAGSPKPLLSPEVSAYQTVTGITDSAAVEIELFLRQLRHSGTEPALFWIGGSRYGSISGTQARAVIGGTGNITGQMGVEGERFGVFRNGVSVRFNNPLKNASQSRVGLFVGAAVNHPSSFGELVGSGGSGNPRGPSLSAAWGGGNFRVFSSSGSALNHPGFGGYAKPGAFLPYIGAACGGSYSVLCGIGKSVGSRESPLRYQGMDPQQFPGGTFVNYHDHITLGSAGFSGNIHFLIVTASDLTDNRRAYDLVSIPRRCGLGNYGMHSAVVFLGDSITFAYHPHVWRSSTLNPPHAAGGQWNLNSLGLLANATGEGNSAQIKYFEEGAVFALDPETWNHIFFVCGSGGHYDQSSHVTQNPLTPQAKAHLDDWIAEYHERIAIPAAETGASVVQMTYIYGCPNKFSPAIDPEIYRTFSDHMNARQKEVALAAGFAIFDAYRIPQLHAPLPAFYSDTIHPNDAGNRLLAQEFAASVANPGSRIPKSVTRPVLSGSATTGGVISSSRGTWSFDPLSHSYQWMRDAIDIPGATSNNYTIAAQDIGYHLSCRVTATNSHGSAERTSAHSVMVGQ